MKIKTKMILKQIGVWILCIIGYIVLSVLFSLGTGYKLGYLFSLAIFFIAGKWCSKIKENAFEQMSAEEIKKEEEKSDLWLLIVGCVFIVLLIAFLIYCGINS